MFFPGWTLYEPRFNEIHTCRSDLCDPGAKWAPRDTAFPPRSAVFHRSGWFAAVVRGQKSLSCPSRQQRAVLLPNATGSFPLSTSLPVLVSEPLGLLQDLQSSLILVFHNSHVCTLQIMGKTLTCMSDD